jgi:hypothetical protein
MYVIIRMEVATMSEMGKDAMIPAMVERTAMSGLVPKKQIEMVNPSPKATPPTLSAGHRRIANKYRATIMGSKMSSVPRSGSDAIIMAKTMILIHFILGDCSHSLENISLKLLLQGQGD